MIDITKLYFGQNFTGDNIRFSRLPDRKPVVVWTMTRKCNLDCIHCYSSSGSHVNEQFDTEHSKTILDKIIRFKPPALLLSGGEPLMKPDFFETAGYAVDNGLNLTLSTNGTLIGRREAERLAKIGFRYVGISIDGPEDVHDRFRKHKGSFARALNGIRNCKAAGLKVGLRLTISKTTLSSIPFIFSMAADEYIDRLCFYHLYEAGRGKGQSAIQLDEPDRKYFMDMLIDETGALMDKGLTTQVLTVGNRFDGIYLYKKMIRTNPEQASRILKLLKISSQNKKTGIINIDSDGSVYSDQFSRDLPLGNVLHDSLNNIYSSANRHSAEFKIEKCLSCGWQDLCIDSSIAASKRTQEICYA